MPDDGTHSATPPGSASLLLERRLTIDGVSWVVRLFVNTYDRRRRPDLVFESYAVVRRVRDYPDHWHTLGDEALFALSHGR